MSHGCTHKAQSELMSCCESHANVPSSRLKQTWRIIYLQILFVCCRKAKSQKFSLKGVQSALQRHKHTNTHPDPHSHTDVHEYTRTLTHRHSHTHTDTLKQHASLQDEYKRFIFRPLGPLQCSGFTERMRELPCPPASICVGVGLLLWPQAGRSCLSVGQCEDRVQQSADGYTVVAKISVFSATKHSIYSLSLK